MLVVVAGTGFHPQAPSSPLPYVAFRVDDERLIATVLIRDPTPPRVTEGLSPRPVARYGYQHFAPPAWWRDRPLVAPSSNRWSVHLAPGLVIDAVAEQVVGGYAACDEAVGVLLRAVPEHATALARSPARYFVALPSGAGSARAAGRSSLGARPVPPSPEWRPALESALDELLARELPRVRAEAAPALSRMEASTVGYHRSWARERWRVEIAMERGEGKRQYDVQAFQLGPGAPVYFARAEWLVERRQGFAASLWFRTDPRVDVIEADVRPALWLRMFEFQGRVARDHLGLVLNVIDRDGDGLAEVIFLKAGYEGFRISLLEYSSSGLTPTGLSYGGGC